MDTNKNIEQNKIGKTLKYINKNILLKSILFGLLFYIVISPFFIKLLRNILPIGFDIIVIQSIVFAITYYLIEIAL